MEWYEIWSKAGATPNYRVDNFEEYLKNFNWVSNWVDKYFLINFLIFFRGNILNYYFINMFLAKKIKFKIFNKYFLCI